MIQEKNVRINVGGEEYKDKEGNIWYADKAYVKGSWGCLNLAQTDILNTSDLVSDTSDSGLFQAIRMGEQLVYRFDLSNGWYQIRLLFAEIYWETDSAEQQDVYVQNKRVLKNFNIYDEVGHDRALEKRFKIEVTQRYLKLEFIGRSLPMHSGARVCAIEIRPISKGKLSDPTAS